MKAMCPRCSHVIYWFDDSRVDLSPENLLNNNDLATVCEYDGAQAVSAPGNEMFHTCRNCSRQYREDNDLLELM